MDSSGPGEAIPLVGAYNGDKNESVMERRFQSLIERMDRLAAVAERSSTQIYSRRLNTANIANPAPVGLFAFAIATALYMTSQAHIVEQSTQFISFTLGIFLGGLTMLITAAGTMLITGFVSCSFFCLGFFELFRMNALGATAFAVYGAFWMTVGVYGIIRTAGIFFLESPHGEQALTILFACASLVFTIAALAINLALPFLFFNLTIMFCLLAGGVQNTTVARVAGWWGIWTSGIAFYCGTAALLRDLWGKEVLPMFFTKAYLRHEKVLLPRVHVEEDEEIGVNSGAVHRHA